MFNIFEQPWVLTITAVVILFSISVLEILFPEKRLRWLMIIPALLAPAAFGLDYFIETDGEKIDTLISIVTEAVENKDPNLIETLIADDYKDSYHSLKKDLMPTCLTTLSNPFIKKSDIKIISTEIHPQKTTLIFTVRILFDTKSQGHNVLEPRLITQWQADLQKQSDGRLLINRIELLKIGFKQASFIDFLPMM